MQVLSDTETELKRLNWALEAYRRSSSALLRNQGFQDLAQRVCNALVGDDTYALACVGLAETSGGKPVRIVASAGRAVAYLDGLHLSWADDLPEGTGPTGRAIRSGQAHVMRDSRQDPAYVLWQARGDRFGIRSSVTVPFKRHGRAIGALLVYALTPDAFGPRELGVFEQLGEELVFAMTIAEQQQRMKDAEAAQAAAESALRESQMEMMRMARVAALGEFAASIAHELNQPLAAIVTSSDAALRWLSHDPPNLDKAMDSIRRSAKDSERASQTIRRLQALVTKRPTQFDRLDLNKEVRAVLQMTEREQRRAGVSVTTSLARGLPRILGDRILIQQVLLNLVVNGLDAMRDSANRKMAVRTRRTDDGGVLVEIEDRGVGLDAALAGRVFEPFYTTKDGGTGLGLPIARSIIDVHGGRIWAEPAPTGGALFAFTLPTQPKAPV